jgi:hypothetical protein
VKVKDFLRDSSIVLSAWAKASGLDPISFSRAIAVQISLELEKLYSIFKTIDEEKANCILDEFKKEFKRSLLSEDELEAKIAKEVMENLKWI